MRQIDKLGIIVLFYLPFNTLAFELEYGLGITSIQFPSYRGAQSQSLYTLPFPYLKFKSDILEIDRGGIQAKLFNINNLSLNLSVAGSMPSDTFTATERQGMPQLDIAMEAGPAIVYKLYQSKGGLFQIELPARAVITTNLSSTQILGYNLNPIFYYERDVAGVKSSFSLGRLYSSKNVADYYYSVAPQFATQNRPVYQAGSGYISDMFRLIISKKFTRHHWTAILFQYDNLNNAVIANSPLVKSKSAIQLGLAYAYIFQSMK